MLVHISYSFIQQNILWQQYSRERYTIYRYVQLIHFREIAGCEAFLALLLFLSLSRPSLRHSHVMNRRKSESQGDSVYASFFFSLTTLASRTFYFPGTFSLFPTRFSFGFLAIRRNIATLQLTKHANSNHWPSFFPDFQKWWNFFFFSFNIEAEILSFPSPDFPHFLQPPRPR